MSGITVGGNDDRGTADRTLIARNMIANHLTAAWSEYGFAVTQYKAGRGNVVRNNVFWHNEGTQERRLRRLRGPRQHRARPAVRGPVIRRLLAGEGQPGAGRRR